MSLHACHEALTKGLRGTIGLLQENHMGSHLGPYVIGAELLCFVLAQMLVRAHGRVASHIGCRCHASLCGSFGGPTRMGVQEVPEWT